MPGSRPQVTTLGSSAASVLAFVAVVTIALAPYAHALLPGHNQHHCAWCQMLAAGGIVLAAAVVLIQVALCCLAAPAPVVVPAARSIPVASHPRAPPH